MHSSASRSRTLLRPLVFLLAATLASGSVLAQDRRESPAREGPRADGPRGEGRWLDNRHGQNRVYPSPGVVVRAPPAPSRVVVWSGVNYRFHDGVWYSPGPRGYVVVRPPLGIMLYDRPAVYSVVTIGAIAYLYANGVYYREYPGRGYEVVAPPMDDKAAVVRKMYVYPRNGQSAEQQASDEYDCHKWATGQSGFDPTAAATGQGGVGDSAQRDGYQRARSACLEGRGYTVR